MKLDLHAAGTRWQTKGVNSTFQNETSVSCVAQRYASYSILMVREFRSVAFIDLSVFIVVLLLGSSTATLMICLILMHYTVSAFLALSTVENSSLASFFYISLTILILSSYPFTYPSGSYNYNSIKICKQISTPPQPYQKISHIYFLRSCPLPNLISILSPITIQLFCF